MYSWHSRVYIRHQLHFLFVSCEWIQNISGFVDVVNRKLGGADIECHESIVIPKVSHLHPHVVQSVLVFRIVGGHFSRPASGYDVIDVSIDYVFKVMFVAAQENIGALFQNDRNYLKKEGTKLKIARKLEK